MLAGSAAQHMRQRMTRVFPALSEVDFDYLWGGQVAMDGQQGPPHFRPGLLAQCSLLQGYSGQGVRASGVGRQNLNGRRQLGPGAGF